MTSWRAAALFAVLVGGTAAVTAACAEDVDTARSEGERLYNTRGCVACHGPGGSGGMAPAWEGIYMSEVTLVDDTVVLVDDEYLRVAITDPDAQRVKGYPKMPSNNLNDIEVQAIIDWLKTLS